MTKIDKLSEIALYELIYDKRWIKGYSWNQISDSLQFGLNNKAMQKRFKRLSIKVKQPYKPEKIQEKITVVQQVKKIVPVKIDEPIDDVPYYYNMIDWDEVDAYVDKVIEWMYKYTAEWFHWEPCPEYIREMIVELLYGDKIVLLEPRFHGKTNTMVCLFAYWMIELRKTVMVIVQSNDHQLNIFNMIVNIFECDAVIQDYGELIHKKSGRPNYTITLIEEYQHGIGFSFFKAASISGGYVGLHPDWTHLDDIVQKKIRNDDTFKNFMEDFDGNVLDLSPDKTTISGTRKELGDFYDMAFDRGFLPLHNKAIEFIRGTYPSMDDAILKKKMYRSKMRTQVIGFKQEYLDSIEVKTMGCPNYGVSKILARYLSDPNSFFSQLQNEPIPRAGNIFKPHWIKQKKYSEMPDNFKYMDKENVVDPAFGSSYTSSDTAMIICGMFEGVMYVTEIISGKFPNDDLTDEMERVKVLHKIQLTHCEDDYAQITNRFDKSNKFWDIGVTLYSNKKKGSKRDRVSNLSNPLKFGHIVFMEGCTHWDLFDAQYLRYDASSEKGIDILDALASAYRLIYEEDDQSDEEIVWEVIGGSDGFI